MLGGLLIDWRLTCWGQSDAGFANNRMSGAIYITDNAILARQLFFPQAVKKIEKSGINHTGRRI